MAESGTGGFEGEAGGALVLVARPVADRGVFGESGAVGSGRAHVAVVERIGRGERRPEDSWGAPTGRISSCRNAEFARVAG